MFPPCHHQPVDSYVYLVDHLQFMQEQEETTYRIPPFANYLDPSHAAVTETDRCTMLDWSYEIVRACAIPRELACIGIQYFDRFLCTAARRATASLASRREFQLAFIACLVVALKCRSGLQVDAVFVRDNICQGLYDAEEILAMERDVLRALQWRLNGPSPHEFIAGMVALLPPGVACHADGDARGDALAARLTALAHAHAERALRDYATALTQSPSSLAYAALMAALPSLGTDAFRPLARLTWMSNIDTVTHRTWAAGGAASRASAAPKHVRHCGSIASLSTLGSPVTASGRPEENMHGHRPQLDELSLASGSTGCETISYLSPISSMLDDFLHVYG